MIPADFPWRPGMLVSNRWSGHRFRIILMLQDAKCLAVNEVTAEVGVGPLTECDPVQDDPATIGALAGAVREAWRDPYAHAVPLVEGSLVGPPRWRWRVLCAIPGPEPIRVRLRDFIDDDLGTAWLAAWAARPRSTP